MSREIRVLVVRGGAEPTVETLDGELSSAQALVGGYLERLEVDPDLALAAGSVPTWKADELDLWLNEEGIQLGLPVNFLLPGVAPDFTGTIFEGAEILGVPPDMPAPGEVGVHRVLGDVFFARHDGEGNMASVTDEDVVALRAVVRSSRALARVELCMQCHGTKSVCNECEKPGDECKCPEHALPTPMPCPACFPGEVRP